MAKMKDPIGFIAAVFRSYLKIGMKSESCKSNQNEASESPQPMPPNQEQSVVGAQNDNRQRSLEEPPPYRSNTAPDDIIFVMKVLGQRLIELGIVDFQAVPQFNALVESNLPDHDWVHAYSGLCLTAKYEAAIGISLCAECAPMHIYRGFGAAMFNDWSWCCIIEKDDTEESASQEALSTAGFEMDKMLSVLKSIPSTAVLTKVPKGVSSELLDLTSYDLRAMAKEHKNWFVRRMCKKYIKVVDLAMEDYNRNGLPPLKDGSRFTKIRQYWATWDSDFGCKDTWEDCLEVAGQQTDPGRLLHAFIVGGYLDVDSKELGIYAEAHIAALVRWLHECPGTSFRVIESTDIDWSSFKLSKKCKRLAKSLKYDIEKDIQNLWGGIAVAHEPLTAAAQAIVSHALPTSDMSSAFHSDSKYVGSPSTNKALTDSPPIYADGKDWEVVHPTSVDEKSPNSSQLPRREAPPAPIACLRRAKTIRSFDSFDVNELSIKLGEVVEVLQEMGDGWMNIRRLDGSEGLMPVSYTASLPNFV